jgi:hypothetical protein
VFKKVMSACLSRGRYGEVEDPYGFVWAIATHLEDLTAEEIEIRRKTAFGGGPPAQA